MEQLYFFSVAEKIKIRVLKPSLTAFCFFQNAADSGVSILAVGTGKSVKGNGLCRIEIDALGGAHPQQIEFYGTNADLFRSVFYLRIRKPGLGITTANCGFRQRYHRRDKIVGINDLAFSGLHFAFRQIHHTVGQMITVFGPFIPQGMQDCEQTFKMIFLFTAHNINRIIQVVIADFQDSGADILADIETGVVGAQHRHSFKFSVFVTAEFFFR